jgi:hypothetical protein
VSLVIDNCTVELVRTVPLPACFSQQLPVVNGTLLIPAVDCFGPLDWVLVVYDIEPGKKKSPFFIMAGNSDNLRVLHLMHRECMAREDEGACWREVEDNWSIMLGNESKNYEITAITLFRNDERERLFLQEVEALAEKPRTSSADSAGDSDVDPLKRQVMRRLQAPMHAYALYLRLACSLLMCHRSWATSRSSPRSSACFLLLRTKASTSLWHGGASRRSHITAQLSTVSGHSRRT